MNRRVMRFPGCSCRMPRTASGEALKSGRSGRGEDIPIRHMVPIVERREIKVNHENGIHRAVGRKAGRCSSLTPGDPGIEKYRRGRHTICTGEYIPLSLDTNRGMLYNPLSLEKAKEQRPCRNNPKDFFLPIHVRCVLCSAGRGANRLSRLTMPDCSNRLFGFES